MMEIRQKDEGGPTIPNDSRRPWERYWDETLRGKYFLRNSGQVNHPSRFFIVDAAAKYDTVLECGCATAIDYPLHVERGTKYTGIDITRKFKETAEELYPDIDFRIANVLDLSMFPDRSYDTVYERAVFEHMHPLEWPLGCKEMWRVADKQIILGLFGWQIGSPPRRKPILERLNDENDKDTPEKRAERAHKTPQAIVEKLYHDDIVSVIEKFLPGKKTWRYDKVIRLPGRKGKPYHMYTVARVD